VYDRNGLCGNRKGAWARGKSDGQRHPAYQRKNQADFAKKPGELIKMLSRVKNKLYDSSKIDKQNLMFDHKALRTLLIPVILEQLLNSLMGMVDTMMVSNVSSAAISAVSLVDSVNNLLIQIFSALAAGATIICAQYLGKKDTEGANRAARQVFLSILVISTVVTVVSVLFREPLLALIFGKVEPEVMRDSLDYFLLTALSYPFMALFSAGSAFYRAGGNSRFPMMVSVISNIGNVVGNALFLFVFDMGVTGAALATLLSRIVCTVIVFAALHRPKQEIVLNHYLRIRPDFKLIWVILAIGVPSGIENGMFQFGKLAIQSTVSTMGTAAIAAQAMTIILEMMNGIAAIGIGIGLMTVVGQCIGAGRTEEAIRRLKLAVEAAYAFENRPESGVIHSFLLGDETWHRSDFETSDTRPLHEILRDKWLADSDFDAIRNTEAFGEILSDLG